MSQQVIPQRSSIKTLLALSLLLLLALEACHTSFALARWALLPGPNSMGEAGKVYFALRAQQGQTIFPAADGPPYYPATHGALLHGLVGGLGGLLESSPTELYRIGRGISMAGAAWSLGLLWYLACRIGLSAGWRLGICLALLTPVVMVHHAVSYRPEFWLLALSATAATLLVGSWRSLWVLIALATLPTLAFFVKAPGVTLLGATVFGLVIQGRQRAAGAVLVAGLAVLAGSVAMVDFSSEGRFLANLQGGMAVPFSWRFPWTNFFLAPMIVLPVLSPLLFGAIAFRVRESDPDPRQASQARVLGVFWAVSLLTAVATGCRAGSNSYYYLESFYYGLPIGARVLHALVAEPRSRWLGGIVGLVFFGSVILQSVTSRRQLDGEVAVILTNRYAEARERVAARINREGWSCYSDDPGLNVLLNEPAVLYPWLQQLFIHTGALDPECLLTSEGQTYKRIYLTGQNWQWHGHSSISNDFSMILQERYQQIASEDGYAVYVPLGSGDPAQARSVSVSGSGSGQNDPNQARPENGS